ncbi:MAG: hypothetical protein ACREXY_15630, partial [Gammaproteobacteria bacterium]
PDVVSVPTQRLTAALTEALLATRSDVNAGLVWSSSTHSNGSDPVIYITESLLARKLGLADALERDQFQFDAALAVVSEGFAEYGLHDREHIWMPNILVRLRDGSDCLPESTASYSALRWVASRELEDAVEAHDPLVVVPDGDPLDLCIHGLCVMTSVAVIKQGLVDQALMTL